MCEDATLDEEGALGMDALDEFMSRRGDTPGERLIGWDLNIEEMMKQAFGKPEAENDGR